MNKIAHEEETEVNAHINIFICRVSIMRFVWKGKSLILRSIHNNQPRYTKHETFVVENSQKLFDK